MIPHRYPTAFPLWVLSVGLYTAYKRADYNAAATVSRVLFVRDFPPGWTLPFRMASGTFQTALSLFPARSST